MTDKTSNPDRSDPSDRRRRYTDAERAAVLNLYDSGKSSSEIAISLGVHARWASLVVQEAGKTRSRSENFRTLISDPMRHPRRRRDLPDEELKRRYIAGESAKRLAAEFGTMTPTIQRHLVNVGCALRSHAEAVVILDRTETLAARAKRRDQPRGFGEDILERWLVERGERPDAQHPVGPYNVDLALYPIAVEITASTCLPTCDPRCRKRIKDLANRGWISCYVFTVRRVLLPTVADQIVAFAKAIRRDPSADRQHRVIRGCGELAAAFGDDFNDITLIPPSKSCPHHGRGYARLGQ